MTLCPFRLLIIIVITTAIILFKRKKRKSVELKWRSFVMQAGGVICFSPEVKFAEEPKREFERQQACRTGHEKNGRSYRNSSGDCFQNQTVSMP